MTIQFSCQAKAFLLGLPFDHSCETGKGYKEAYRHPKKTDGVFAMWLKKNLPRVKTLYAPPQSITDLYKIDQDFRPYWNADLVTFKSAP